MHDCLSRQTFGLAPERPHEKTAIDGGVCRKIHPTNNNKDLLNKWLKDGINSCEQASADFSLAMLRQRNPGANCRDTYDWYYDMGGPASALDGRP